MAALCTGDRYNLSSQGNSGDKIEYIFVKFTDSSYKAIQEYQRIQNIIDTTAQIQLQENGGHLSIPSSQASPSTFSFSLSTTSDIEGPQGSFECVQKTNGRLSSLGALSRKMRIHANDDVYEATRNRMAVVQNKQKNNCARVIKHNESDIGRKVKVKQIPGRTISIPKREPPPMSVIPPKPITSLPPIQRIQHNNTINGYHNGIDRPTVNSPHSRVNNHPKPPAKPDIMKRPIRERLVHILALRPHKKLEIYTRLSNEGIKEKEKPCIATVLKQISQIRDNSYNLLRYLWNDVHDDWPFYTDEEREVLKRKKPQNLTPPTSSDGGSSGSGQSPNSVHPGSPPPTISSSSLKRELSSYDSNDATRPKKQRISHYRKATDPYNRPPPDSSNNKPSENGYRRPTTDSREASNMNPRSREEIRGGYISNNSNGSSGYGSVLTCDDDNVEPVVVAPRRRPSDNRISFGVVRDKSMDNIVAKNGISGDRFSASPIRYDKEKTNKDITNGRTKNEDLKWNKVTSTTNRSVTPSPDSQADRAERITDVSGEHQIEGNINSFDLNEAVDPDYTHQYQRITSIDQRRMYKKDFDEFYEEYKTLHNAVDSVSQKFLQLEERLKSVERGCQAYKEIKRQIVKEYNLQVRTDVHNKNKERFEYLHHKLSHIKKLVTDFDNELKAEMHMDY